jgi:hypothetical protein
MALGVRLKALVRSKMPDPTTTRLTVASPKTWIMLVGNVLMVAGSLLWVFHATTVRLLSVDEVYLVYEPPTVEVMAPATGVLSAEPAGTGVVQAGESVAAVRLSDGAFVPVIVPSDGRVDSLLVSPGAFVRQGDVVADLIPTAPTTLVAHAFVPIVEGQRLGQGIRAEIAVDGYSEDVYGRLVGVVEHVSERASTLTELQALFGSGGLAQEVFESGPYLDVTIRLLGSDTAGGLVWARGQGPESLAVLSGAPAQADLILGSYHPIDLLAGRVQ